MPTAVSYPGVYIEEVPSGVRTITGVATSITAFVGSAPKGPSNKPVRVQNFADYERQFGGLHADHMLGYAVSQFFANGGTDAVIVRILNDGSATSAEINLLLRRTDAAVEADAAATEFLTLEAKQKGASGNTLRVHVSHDTTDPTDGRLFNLLVTDGDRVEEFVNLSTDATNAGRFFVSVLDAESELLRVKTPPTWTTAPEKWRPDSHVDPFAMFEPKFADHRFKSGDNTLALGDTAGGSWTLTKNANLPEGNIVGRVEAEPLEKFTLYLANRVKATGKVAQLEVYRGLKKETAQTRLAASKLVDVPAVAPLLPLKPNAGQLPSRSQATVFNYDDNGKKSFASVGTEGNDGDSPSEADILGNPDAKTGLFSLDKVDLFNLLCVPPLNRGTTISDPAYAAALNYCIQRRAMLIVDSPAAWTSIAVAEAGINSVRASLGGANNCKNAAMYFPRLRMPDAKQENRLAEFASCGAVAGIFAKTDAQRGVWKAPAGIEAGLGGVREFTVKMTDPENGRLNQLGLNCLRNFPVAGNLVWGARTLAGADALASEHKYVPVRRLQLFIEESLYRGTQWVVFEPNDEPLWAQIRLNVGVFMQGLFRKGAFQGRTPNEAFFVRCDKTTTTQADINLGIVNIDVGFAPLKPAEFVVIRIQQIAGDLTA